MSVAARARESEPSAAPPDRATESRAERSVQRLQQQLGNRNIQKLFAGGFTVAPPDHPLEREAHAIAHGAMPAARANVESHPVGGGTPIDPVLRMVLQPRVGRDLGGVRMHHDPAATDALNAHAFTAGSDIVLGTRTPDLSLLAHEAAHAGDASPMVFRQTAQEIIDAYEPIGNEALGFRLGSLALRGQYTLVREVIEQVGYFSRDNVAMAMLNSVTIPQIIAMARNEAGRSMLQRVREEVMSGWATPSEWQKGRLVAAVLGTAYERRFWNRQRVDALRGNDLEQLALMFEDEAIVDDGTVQSRLEAVLEVTAHFVVPGLQTGGPSFSDTGFRGTQDPNGPGFRDPHPTSRNQPGHFLTAVGLRFRPELVSRPILVMGGESIRSLVHAPATMSDEEVALRLTIGHERAPDPPEGWESAVRVLAVGVAEEWFGNAPEGETPEQRRERAGRAAVEEGLRRRDLYIQMFTAQFNATTDADVAAWNETVGRIGSDPAANTAALEGPDSPLNRISVDPTLKGNSRQDLRLSLMGWRLGQMIRNGDFATNAEVAAWIRRNLGP